MCYYFQASVKVSFFQMNVQCIKRSNTKIVFIYTTSKKPLSNTFVNAISSFFHNHPQDGPGKLYGIDLSTYCCDHVSSKMAAEIASGKLHVSNENVMIMPFSDNHFDRVFHTNCFYFWPNMDQACMEMYRVMKPNSVMVTCMNMKSVKEHSETLLKGANTDPLNFMLCLERCGFQEVKVNYLKDEASGMDYMAILAHVHEKKDIDGMLEEIARKELRLEQEEFKEQPRETIQQAENAKTWDVW